MSVHIRAGDITGEVKKIVEVKKYKCHICHSKWTRASKLIR